MELYFCDVFKSHSRTPRINSNQFRITLNDAEKNSGKRKRKMQSIVLQDSLPFVSVIVPVRNEERYIQRCLLSLLAQDYPRFEVVVICLALTILLMSIIQSQDMHISWEVFLAKIP